MRGSDWRLVFAICLMSVLSLARFVPAAQPVDASGSADPSTDATGVSEPADSSSSTPSRTLPLGGSSEVDVRVAQCGVASAARVGDWFGLQVELQDSAAKIRNVVVRLSMKDADGDIAFYERAALPNPGRWESVWLYARLPFTAESLGTLDITVHEAIETGAADAAGADGSGSSGAASSIGVTAGKRFNAGRVIGGTRYPIQRIIPAHVTTWAVIGDRGAGLEQYGAVRMPKSFGLNDPPPTGHELIEVFRPQSLTALPDRWMGWAQFEVIAWTGGSSASAGGRDQPNQLSESQAAAIKEWVRRGGHLVIVLPPVGQPWLGSGAAGNPLSDILPTVGVRRVEGVNLEPFRTLLTNARDAALPKNATVQYLIPNSSTDTYSAMSIYDAPFTADGASAGTTRPVVVRRLVGAGAVTVVGLDVASPLLTDVANALQAHVFWGRVLGERMETPSPTEIARRSLTTNGIEDRAGTVESAASLDESIGGRLRMSGESAAGLLLAFVVFLAYWLIAGPLGYFGLKAKGLRQHSWLGFVGATVIFTGIAWGGANLLKGRQVSVRHVTIVDHVFGQSNQRARTWLNIYFPTYGEEEVSTLGEAASGGGGGGAASGRNIVAPWEPPESSRLTDSFPDARGYGVDARSSGSLSVPVRATAKQFQVDWAGALGSKWGMPLPEAAAGGSTPSSVPGTATDAAGGATIKLGDEIRLVQRPNARGRERTWALQGQLTHNMPVPLQDVAVIVNLGVRERVNPRTGQFFNGAVVSIREWKPGQPLDLGSLFPLELNSNNSVETWLNGRPAMAVRSSFDVTFSLQEQNDNLADIALYSLFGLVAKQSNNSLMAGWAVRRASHGYDVSRWLTQPSVIIIGRMDNVACPVPVTVGGEALPNSTSRNLGTVIVRWMYPLPASPPAMESHSGSEDVEAPAQPGSPASSDGATGPTPNG